MSQPFRSKAGARQIDALAWSDLRQPCPSRAGVIESARDGGTEDVGDGVLRERCCLASGLSRLNLRRSLPPLAKRIVNCRLSRCFALSVAHLRASPSLRVDEALGTWAGTLSGDRERLTITASLFPVSVNPWKP